MGFADEYLRKRCGTPRVPGWLWLVAGLATSFILFSAFLMPVFDRAANGPTRPLKRFEGEAAYRAREAARSKRLDEECKRWEEEERKQLEERKRAERQRQPIKQPTTTTRKRAMYEEIKKALYDPDTQHIDENVIMRRTAARLGISESEANALWLEGLRLGWYTD